MPAILSLTVPYISSWGLGDQVNILRNSIHGGDEPEGIKYPGSWNKEKPRERFV